MKRMILLILLFSTVVFGQVSSIPEFATENDSIVIFFDATAGDAGLMGFSGDIYAHTGVITTNSTGPSDWKYVVADWGVNIPKIKLTRLSADSYELIIGKPRQYYGLTDPTEKILQLAFVFRNSTGSMTGRGPGGADIFHDLYEPGITAVLITPQINLLLSDPRYAPVFANAGDLFQIEATAVTIGTQIAELLVESNGTVLYQTGSDTLNHTLTTVGMSHGYQNLNIIAVDTLGIKDTAAVPLFINGPVQDVPVPAGVTEGINYNSGTSVTLSLFAPYKNYIYVIGDFNNWFVEPAYQMKRDYISADSVRYWLTIDNLTAGQEYAFQYLVDGDIRVADAYTDKILSPWNDQYISSATYPNLKPYPTGKTLEPVSILQTDQSSFNWQHSANFQRPAREKLVIYEMLLRDFIANHDFATMIDTLNYFQKLGINAIELMPVNEFEGNSSWGYNPSFYFAPDKYYGPKDEFKRFVDACHQRGIAVIIDMVLNHAYGQNPFVRMYWNEAQNRPAANNPWFNPVSPNPVFSWGNDFNHHSVHTKAFVDRVNKYWLAEYKVDGFRFDFTKGFTNTGGDGWAYDGQRINILKRMANKIWEVDTSAYIILEHFAENTEEKILAEYGHGMMLWGNLNYSYNEATMGYHENGKSDFSWGFYKNRGWTEPHLVTYMESHDEERLMFKNITYGNGSGSYSIQDTTTAIERIKIAAAFFLTQPGPKMIWQFGEMGYDYSIDYNGRIGEKPIRWDYLQQERREKLYKTYAALLKLRNENPVFTSEQSSVNMWLNDGSGLKRVLLQHHTMNVSVIGNFGVATQSINPNLVHPGMWYDYFAGDSMVITTSQPIELAPGEFRILTDKKLETPETGLVVGIEDDFSAQIPREFQLLPNYPNPFNPTTKINFIIPELSKVEINIYNILGQKIKVLAKKDFNSGTHKLQWNGTNQQGAKMASGIYILEFKANDFRRYQRLVLMK